MDGRVQVSRSFVVLLTVVIVVAVLRYAQDVFIPLALAILLTFLLAPVVERLQRWGLNRVLAVGVSVAVAFAIIGGLVYVVFDQLADLVTRLPQYRRQLRANLADLTGMLHGGVSETTRAVEQLTREIERVTPEPSASRGVPRVQVVEPSPGPVESLRNLLGPLLGPIGTAAVVVLFVIFMLLRLPDLRDRLIRLLGARNLRATTEALDDAARRVSRYLLMQTIINGVQGLLVGIGLSLIGLPNAVLWGALTVVLRFIPYVGPWVAAGMPVALSFAVFDGWTYPLLTVALLVVLEFISNIVLEPWLYGSRTGVSPTALLVAAAFWTWLWGAVGLLLAIPMTVCLVVMGKYIPQLEFLQVLLGDEPVLEPHERLYQRLLAGNRDEADDLLEDALQSQTLLEVCDSIVVPAMQLAEVDHDRGALRESKRRSVMAHIDQWTNEVIEARRSEAQEHEPAVERETAGHGEAGQSEAGRDEDEASEPGDHASIPPVSNAADLFAGHSLACVPAADQADEVAAKLLAAILAERGAEAVVTRIGAGARPEVDAVIVSALPPEAVVPARRVCRQARAAFGSLPLIVGLWNASGDMQRSRQRLESAGASRLVTNFAQCLAECEALLPAAGRRPAGPEPVSDTEPQAQVKPRTEATRA